MHVAIASINIMQTALLLLVYQSIAITRVWHNITASSGMTLEPDG